MRIAILGNAGSGKSTLSKRLAAAHNLPRHEVDALQWNPDWTPVDADTYNAAHAKLIAQDAWVLDGPGRFGTMADRLDRATHIIHCDLPLWQNYWLLAERQAAWQAGKLDLRPGGYDTPPPTKDLFKVVWQIDQDWVPKWRDLLATYEGKKPVIRITDVAQLDGVAL